MNIFRNMRIGPKLTLSFLLVVGIFIFVIWQLIGGLRELEALQKNESARTFDAIAIGDVDSRLEHFYSIAADGVISGNVDEAVEKVKEFKAQALIDIQMIKDAADTSEEKSLAVVFEEKYGLYLDLTENELLPILKNASPDKVMLRDVEGKIEAVRDGAMGALGKLKASLETKMGESDTIFAQTAARDIRNAFLYSAVGVAVALLLSLLVSSAISKPLKLVVAYALDVMNGEIDKDLPIRQMDEVGNVAWAMRRVTESLRKVLSEFDAMSKKVRHGHLRHRADPAAFKGAYAGLIKDANSLADVFVGFMDNIPLPLMALDSEFNVLFLNKPGLDVGAKSEQEATRMKCRDIFKTSDCNTPNCACDKAMKTHTLQRGETDAHPTTGDLEITYTGMPIMDENGKSVGAFETVIDQTDIVRTQKQIVGVAEQAGDISERLSAAADQIAAQVEQSSKGAELQKDRAAEVATAMEEMNATVLEVAKNAADGAESANQAMTRAQEGATLVTKVIEAIKRIETLSHSLKSNMTELGAQAEGIGQVMNVISDIADQTNLLALNAAIEAARAGEAGRGFAVVADEVRKLAEKTMTATKEVGQAIGAIQDNTRKNVEGTEKAVEAVTEGAALAEESGQSLREIVVMVENTADQVQAIAAGAEEQSAASEEINRSVEEINSISSETSDAMTQSAQAVHELAALASDLQNLIKELAGEGGPKALAS
jgi:methyl-accepting chemotaxis protein